MIDYWTQQGISHLPKIDELYTPTITVTDVIMLQYNLFAFASSENT